MKDYKLLVLLLLLVFAGNVSAQYDDMYYDPDRDAGAYDDYYAARQYNQSDRYYDNNYSSRDNYYDDEGYDYYNNHDYHYTSRIRRFHRPYYGFNFFDPVYVDMVYYDPFFTPFNTVLIYDDMFAFNNFWRYNRWNRWNRFGGGGWGPGINVNVNFGRGGWNAWDPWGWNSWNRFGWNSWNRFGGGWGGNNFFVNNYYGVGGAGFYCPPTWGNNYAYNTVDNLQSNTHYGPRTSGTTHTPRLNEREVRRETPKDVTNTTPRTSTPGRDITNTDRVQPVDDGRQISGREDARTERIRLFDENEQGRTNATVDERTQRRSDDYWGRRNGTTDRSTDVNNSRTRVNPNDRSRTNTRTYDNNTRSRNNSIFGTPRNNTNTRSSGRTYDNSRNNTRTSPNYGNSRTNRSSGGSISPSRSNPRSSGSSMGSSRSSSPTRSSGSMGSSRSSGSSRAGSSSSGSRSSSSRRGGNQ